MHPEITQVLQDARGQQLRREAAQERLVRSAPRVRAGGRPPQPWWRRVVRGGATRRRTRTA